MICVRWAICHVFMGHLSHSYGPFVTLLSFKISAGPKFHGSSVTKIHVFSDMLMAVEQLSTDAPSRAARSLGNHLETVTDDPRTAKPTWVICHAAWVICHAIPHPSAVSVDNFSHHPENRMLDMEKPADCGLRQSFKLLLVVRHPHSRCGHRRIRRLSWQSGRLAPQRMPFLRFVANRQCLCCLTRTWRETLLEPRGTDACGFQCSLPSASRPATSPGR